MSLVKISEIFDVSYGTKFDMNKMSKSKKSNIAFISRSSKNNGMVAYVDKYNSTPPLQPGLLTVTLGGTYVLSAFLQELPFYTAQNVAVLTPKDELTKEEKLYYCTCITKNRYRYGAFGREANRTLKDLLIPSIKDIPEWVNETKLDRFKDLDKKIINTPPSNLAVEGWIEFKYIELFEIKKGLRLTKANMTQGGNPFIGSTDSNNGLTARIGQNPIHKGNTITVNYNGSVGEAFYQPKDFWASDDVNVLYPKESKFPKFNQFIALFLIVVIKSERYRFNYGRKWHKERMEQSIIRLPVRKGGEIDIDFMENYIKSLSFSAAI